MKTTYSKDIDILIALISYLALSKYKSMRPSRLAERLSLDKENVERVLELYKGIFRKSNRIFESTEEHYYTLHMRYALRWMDEDEDDGDTPQLPPEHVNTLLTFVIGKAAEEEGRRKERIKHLITMIAAIIGAVAAVTTTILSIIYEG